MNQLTYELSLCRRFSFVFQPSFPPGGAQTAVLSSNSPSSAPAPPQAIQRLKDQNRLLTQVQHSPLSFLYHKLIFIHLKRLPLCDSLSSLPVQEVTEKSERITQLEQEKSALIKQLFEARARSAQDTSTLDSTFIWQQLYSTKYHRKTLWCRLSISVLVWSRTEEVFCLPDWTFMAAMHF